MLQLSSLTSHQPNMWFLGFFISLVEGFMGLFSWFHKTTAEKLGKAENEVSNESMTINVLEEEAKAAVNAPANKQELQDTLQKGQL